MKAIIDNLKLKIEILVDVKIGMARNEELLDEKDFCAANRLYQMSGEVHRVINDIFHKLFPEELHWGCQNVFTCSINLSNPNFQSDLYLALNNVKDFDLDIQILNELTDELNSSYQTLLAA